MKTKKFNLLINSITGRNLIIKTTDENLQPETEYYIYKELPLTNSHTGFIWKTPKVEDKFLKTFITAFCSKYKEPNPRAYDWSARTYGEKAKWENKTEIEREYAYRHHSSNMFSKNCLMEQLQANFNLPETEIAMLKYGFYPTEYGIGIFVLFAGERELKAVTEMKKHLIANSIPYSNEFSEARWVLRFKLNLTKDTHTKILNQFSN